MSNFLRGASDLLLEGFEDLKETLSVSPDHVVNHIQEKYHNREEEVTEDSFLILRKELVSSVQVLIDVGLIKYMGSSTYKHDFDPGSSTTYYYRITSDGTMSILTKNLGGENDD